MNQGSSICSFVALAATDQDPCLPGCGLALQRTLGREDRRLRLDPHESLLRISKRPKSAFIEKNVGNGRASPDGQVRFVDLDVPGEDETPLSLTLILVHPRVCGAWKTPSKVRRMFVHDSLQKDTHVRYTNSRLCATQADRIFKRLFCAPLLQASLMGMNMRSAWPLKSGVEPQQFGRPMKDEEIWVRGSPSSVSQMSIFPTWQNDRAFVFSP